MTVSPIFSNLPVDLTPDESALRELVRSFAEAEVAPNASRWWQEERCPIEVLQKMGELDLMGLLVSETDGGTAMSTRGLVAALSEMGRVDQSLAAAWQAHMTIGSLMLATYGTRDQKERWLTQLASGRTLGSFGLTEPNAGSDAAGIQTRADKTDNGWLVNGSKTFISNVGTDMSLGPVILARTGGADTSEYVALLVPRGTAGFDMGPKLRGIGWHALDTRELTFQDVLLPDDHMIGVPGQGLSQFLSILDVGRITVATLGVSLTEAVLDLALGYAKQRTQFGRTLSKFQAIQFKLADLAADLEAIRLLVYRAATLRDAGRPFAKEAAMAKMLGSRLAVRAASEAVQIHGGYGTMYDYPVSRFYCDAKVLEIGEGTNEIQHLIIARHLGC